DVAARSYRNRRWRAVLGYLVGYAACWIGLGAIFAVLRLWPWAHSLTTAAALCFVSAAWAFVPARALCFARCHRQIPLAPVGLRADVDVFRQGVVQCVPCIKMCWMLMVACAITGHDLALMAGGTLMTTAEMRMFRLNRRFIVLGSVGLGMWVIVKMAIT